MLVTSFTFSSCLKMLLRRAQLVHRSGRPAVRIRSLQSMRLSFATAQATPARSSVQSVLVSWQFVRII